jgi:hypothetical protein
MKVNAWYVVSRSYQERLKALNTSNGGSKFATFIGAAGINLMAVRVDYDARIRFKNVGTDG